MLRTEKITKNFEDMENINSLALEAFPPKEYLAPCEIIKMAETKELDFWALYDNNIFVGFMVVKIYKNIVYLFFLAIFSEIRSKGYGKAAIEILKILYPSKLYVVDLELIDNQAKNKVQREKEKIFILKMVTKKQSITFHT